MLFIHVPHHAGSVVEAQDTPEEQRQEETPEEGIPEGDAEDLPECRDHRPADFERGKPRSIFLLRFANYRYKLTWYDCCIRL